MRKIFGVSHDDCASGNIDEKGMHIGKTWKSIDEFGVLTNANCSPAETNANCSPVMTNADKIRAMSDDELAHFLLSHCDQCAPGCVAESECDMTKYRWCIDVYLAWLKKVAE